MQRRNLNAVWELERKKAIREAEASIRKMDEKRKSLAEAQFIERKGLREAIEAEILPNLVSMQNTDGSVGMGFFQHSEWLVSNAHVSPTREHLDAIKAFNYKAEEVPIKVERSLHRPCHSSDAPDLVIAKSPDPSYERKGLPDFNYGDKSHEETYMFYLNLNVNHSDSDAAAGSGDGLPQYELKFLKLKSKKNTYPIIYQCEDGSDPQPGSSGAPIIEARLVIGDKPKWQFRVIGVLYARCSVAWYNSYDNRTEVLTGDDKKLVCAIPAAQDFGQILKILRHENRAERSAGMAEAATLFKYEEERSAGKLHLEKSKESAALAKLGIEGFERGASPLKITLPEGLEKLLGKGIVNFEYSVLTGLKALQYWGFNKQEIAELPKIPKAFPNISKKELEDDFHALLKVISDIESWPVPTEPGNNLFTSPNKYFRVDLLGAADNKWRLDIQDNTDTYYKRRSPSLSSNFATVKFLKTITTISGKELAEQFLESQKIKKEIDTNFNPTAGSGVSKHTSSKRGDTKKPKSSEARLVSAKIDEDSSSLRKVFDALVLINTDSYWIFVGKLYEKDENHRNLAESISSKDFALFINSYNKMIVDVQLSILQEMNALIPREGEITATA